MAYKIPHSLYESGKLPESGGGIRGMELFSFLPVSSTLFERQEESLIIKSNFFKKAKILI